MTTIHYALEEQDAAVIAGLRESVASQKGKYLGVQARPAFEAQKRATPAVPDVRIEPDTVAGVAGWWCRPPEPRSDATLIYYHGGWYMLGSAGAFCNQASHFAASTRTNTFVPDYRLAPESPFPAAYDDAFAVYEQLATRDGGRIALVGDSVGGSLVLLVLSTIARVGARHLPAGAVVMSPVTDLTLGGESMQTRSEVDPIFTQEMVAHFVDAYLDGADPRDVRASPLFGEIAVRTPLRIDVGDQEILLDDAHRYAARAEAAGAEVTLGIWAGMPHTFQGMIGRLAASQIAIEAEARFLNQVLDSSEG